MTEYLPTITSFFQSGRFGDFVRAGIMVAIGLVAAKFISARIGRFIEKKSSPQQALMARRISYYLLIVLVAMSAMRELHFDLSVLLGAAGILTVAVGFASQTSVSNIISGLFLIVDKPFVIGDVVKIGDTVGVVHSVELLSTKIRTFQNGLVRIPNEILFKSEVLNSTAFPIRRLDITIRVAYKENIDRVRELLFDVARKNPLCFDDPAPLFIYDGYGDSSLNLKFCVWTVNQNFLNLTNSMRQEIKEAFDRNGIEIPFPHLSLYTGSVTEPMPVAIVSKA
jgi:small-conductance mechanosensitive channel